MAVAIFNPVVFKQIYPLFAAVSDVVLTARFQRATLILNNTDCSLVRDVNERLMLLGMLTAHLSFLNGDISSNGQPKPVGRLSQAAEGTVSATFEGLVPVTSNGANWYMQTQWGADYWMSTAKYRSARYSPRPTNIFGNNRF